VFQTAFKEDVLASRGFKLEHFEAQVHAETKATHITVNRKKAKIAASLWLLRGYSVPKIDKRIERDKFGVYPHPNPLRRVPCTQANATVLYKYGCNGAGKAQNRNNESFHPEYAAPVESFTQFIAKEANQELNHI
jgi:hypothetical protein